MKEKAIIIIVVITSISLLGIVFTQLFWVKKSLYLKGEQFDNSVRIALKSVINQLLEIKNDSVFQEHLYELSCRKVKLDVTDIVVPSILDSLMLEEMNAMSLSENYYYGIYNKVNDGFATGHFGNKRKELLESPYQFSISSLYKPGNYYLTVYFPTKTSIVLRQMEIWLLMSVFFLVIVIISFIFVILTIFRQKKLAELKTDFINNMTHEFKTPLATTSLAAEMLLRPEVTGKTEKVNKYVKVIIDENQRLKNHVEQVLEISSFENGKKDDNFKETDIHELVKLVVKRFELHLKENNINLTLQLDAIRHTIKANPTEIMNVIFNLLDNAIKYTPVEPRILVKTWNSKNGIFLRIRDNGIGIRPEHQKDVFKNLFRVPTGNIHEVRGFGLGLYYVKKIIDHHHGNIELDSQPGKGSTFDVFFPFNNKTI